MRTISRTAKFKKDYKREDKGQHRATLDADLLAGISFFWRRITPCRKDSTIIR
jgi:hypothetical protein